jgi:hypothetical protein
MTRHALATISAALTAVCVLPYLRDVFRGTTRPRRVSWFVFAAVAVIAFVAQGRAGGTAGVWLAGGAAVGFSAVFIASLWRGVGGFAVHDLVVLGVAALALVLSFAVRGALAVAAVVVAECVAIAPTVTKAIHEPDSETASTWAIDMVAGLCAVVAIGRLSVSELLYLANHAALNALVVGAIAVGRRSGRRTVSATPLCLPVRRSP